jgi:hypothetical protein
VPFEAEEYNPEKTEAQSVWVMIPITLGLVTCAVTHNYIAGLIIFLLVGIGIPTIWKAKPNESDRVITYDDNGINIQQYGAIETIPWSAVVSVSEQVSQSYTDRYRITHYVYVYVVIYTDQTGQNRTIESSSEQFYTFAHDKRYELDHPKPPITNDNHLIIGKKSLHPDEPEK